MTTGSNEQGVAAERPWLLITLGLLGAAGCLSLVAGVLIAQSMVQTHDWVADTISDLGAGRLEIVMDIALYGFAAGLVAMALAAAHGHQGRAGWSIGVMTLAALSAIVIVVGARNEYGDGDSDGVVIHTHLVHGLGAGFFAVPLLLAPGLAQDHPSTARALKGLAVAWVIVAPVFLLSPTGYDGLIERLLGLIACAMILALSAIFLRRGLACRSAAEAGPEGERSRARP